MIVKIERHEIRRWRPAHCQLLGSRDFRAKALSDRSRKLTLDRKQVTQIAIVFLRPEERISANVY
jgi:hypothetical protein